VTVGARSVRAIAICAPWQAGLPVPRSHARAPVRLAVAAASTRGAGRRV